MKLVPFYEKQGTAYPGKSVNPRLEENTVELEASVSGNPI